MIVIVMLPEECPDRTGVPLERSGTESSSLKQPLREHPFGGCSVRKRFDGCRLPFS